MAVAPTGNIFKALSFDNVSSRTYGVYITGEAVYNAPERDVEMVEIPGRNGSFALDKGRFQNIEVSYPAGIFADNEADFAAAISDFRNFLCSRKGYVRLTDEYNPSEYRMAIYKSGLEVSPAQLKAGEFEIVFDCKPQRWLTSGEDAVTIGEWGETETASSDIVSVENPNGVLAVKSLEVDLEPIQSGSGDPSPSNVRPISGHTDVVVSRTGKNLCDTSLVYNGYINVSQSKIASNANARILYLPCKPNTRYTFSKQAGHRFVVAESTVIPTNNVVVSNAVSDYTASSITITTSASAKYLVAFVYLSTADTGVTADQMLATCQIELGSTATTYEPYQGDTYTTALGTTVYGGTLDVTTGVLTVTDANIASYNGETLPSTWISDRDVYASGTTPTTGAQVVYKLATPTTVQLTAQQIELLQGTNNVWANSGDVTVEYGTSPNVLVNPTLFEASPIIIAEGYGTISTGGQSLNVEAVPVGNVFLANSKSETVTYLDDEPSGLADVASHVLDLSNMNTGDTFTLAPTTFTYRVIAGPGHVITSASIYSQTGADANVVASVQNGNAVFVMTFNPIPFVKGTAKTVTHASVLMYEMAGGSTGSFPGDVQIAYDGANTITLSAEPKEGGGLLYTSTGTAKLGEVSGYSTVLVSGEITIDLDIGEAYWENNGSVASANFAVSLGSELMKLKAGANTIAYSNTFTSCKIIPRWWKV